MRCELLLTSQDLKIWRLELLVLVSFRDAQDRVGPGFDAALCRFGWLRSFSFWIWKNWENGDIPIRHKSAAGTFLKYYGKRSHDLGSQRMQRFPFLDRMRSSLLFYYSISRKRRVGLFTYLVRHGYLIHHESGCRRKTRAQLLFSRHVSKCISRTGEYKLPSRLVSHVKQAKRRFRFKKHSHFWIFYHTPECFSLTVRS